MSNFFVVYHIGSSFPGSEVYNNTYEIYNSEEDFLDSLEGYIEYAKSCLCDVDEDDAAEMDQWFEAAGYDKKNYWTYIKLIDEKRENPSINNGLYSICFCEFDVEIEVLLSTTDYLAFIDKITDDFIERAGISENHDGDDLSDQYDEYPILKYTMSLKSSGQYPSKEIFMEKFENDFADSINEGALSLCI